MNEIMDFKYRDIGKDNLNNLKHFHNNCYEVLQIWSGEGVIVIKDKLYPLKSGSLYFINGMDIHCTVPELKKEYIRNKIIVSTSYLESLSKLMNCESVITELFHKGGTLIEPNEHISMRVDEHFLKMHEAINGKPENKLNLTLNLFQIISLAYENKDLTTPPLTNKVSEVLEYINNNITSDLTLDEISTFSHTSKYYLCRIFKQTTNMSIMSYILNRKISIAKKKLLYTDMSISDIAIASGFNSFSYFSRMFKNLEGVTPIEFRKINTKK